MGNVEMRYKVVIAAQEETGGITFIGHRIVTNNCCESLLSAAEVIAKRLSTLVPNFEKGRVTVPVKIEISIQEEQE